MGTGGRFVGQPGKPQIGTAEHHDWLESRAREYLSTNGKPARRHFVAWSQANPPSAGSRDFRTYPGGWDRLMSRALADSRDEDAVGALDFDDVPDTDPGYVPPPIDAVPDGWESRKAATLVGPEGAEKQWLRARPKSERGDLVPEVPDGHHVRGVSTLVSGDGVILNQWIKTDKEREAREAYMRRLTEELPELLGGQRAAPVPAPEVNADDHLAVYPMGDPHFGLLTHAAETGEDFGLEIAERLTVGAMRSLVHRGPRASTALILNVGDYFHADDSTNRTRRSGHLLHTDGSFLRSRQVGLRVLGTMIREALEHHDRVIVENVPGNHDDDSAAWLSVALAVWFEDEPRVEVTQSPQLARYFRFGNNLIGMVHGHNTKPEELGAIMATERPEDWGETVHRYWLCGHLHHTIKKEVRGCTVEVFRTLAARTKYEAGKGFRSGRDMNRITYHREHGEVSREVVSARALQAQYEAEAA